MPGSGHFPCGTSKPQEKIYRTQLYLFLEPSSCTVISRNSDSDDVI